MAGVIAADIQPHPIPGREPETWKSLLFPLQGLLIENLNKTLGISALHVSGTEVLLAAVLIGVGAAAIARRGRAAPGLVLAWPVVAVLLVSLAGIVALELRGVARGGDVRQSLWQFRELVWLPAVVMGLAYVARGVRDLTRIAFVLTATACVKGAIGLYYYMVICLPHGYTPVGVTSHSDTVLFVVVLCIWIAAAVARPTRARVLWATAICAWVFAALIVNHRRTAYVSLAACLMILVSLMPRRTRRRLAAAAILALPFGAVYLAVGRNHASGMFAPAASLYSVITQKDASSAMRDIENYNLMVTLKPNVLAGTGWGHEYVELTQAYDISETFEQYRFVAHNSVLWLLSIGGILGFTMLWLPIPVTIFLAARSHRHARTADERLIAYAAIAAAVAYVIQAWSDMGVGSWTCTFILGAALVASGKLATQTGAWPAGIRLSQRRARPLALGAPAFDAVGARL
jgi:hypothetical protein